MNQVQIALVHLYEPYPRFLLSEMTFLNLVKGL